ncbi:MAG: HDIG domain-containing protein [Chloroflexota bacterium]|nr:HDIG domain-containing protein [Chloroflexota bacterium]
MNLYSSFPFSDLLEQVRSALPPDITAYLVGGAVRDALLNRPVHDLDFALTSRALEAGRRVANVLDGAYYPLDVERQTARVILTPPDGDQQVLDFALLRGADIESDLRDRDFTINAMAVELDDQATLLDPLKGAADLRNGILHTCSDTAFSDDPIRVLRGIRQASAFDLRIPSQTGMLMRQAVKLIPSVSVERIRDELFRVFERPGAAVVIRVMDRMGVLNHVLPELQQMKNVEQSLPHTDDVWHHTFEVLSRLDDVEDVLSSRYDPEASASWALGLISVRLGRYRDNISQHLQASITPGRSTRSLLAFAALYHDSGKPETYQVDEGGRIRFFNHQEVGADIAAARARALRLSNEEVGWVKTVVRNHMRPLLLAQSNQAPSKRAVYRFFRDTGGAGVEVCLHSLADTLATYGPALPSDVWTSHLNVVRELLEAWWEQSEVIISPPQVIRGGELIELLGIEPGPLVGELLDMIREAQATGQVVERDDALALAQSALDYMGDN